MKLILLFLPKHTSESNCLSQEIFRARDKAEPVASVKEEFSSHNFLSKLRSNVVYDFVVSQEKRLINTIQGCRFCDDDVIRVHMSCSL